MSKDKYDRQTRLWGEGQILICQAKLLCLNSDSCTSEILKNLILSGVGEVTIVDDSKITSEDLKDNFFVDADDIGKLRGEIILKNLLELNPDVKGNFINKNSKEYINDEKNDFKSYTILIATNLLAEENNKLYSIAKKNNLRLVIVKNNGLAKKRPSFAAGRKKVTCSAVESDDLLSSGKNAFPDHGEEDTGLRK